MSRPDPTPRHGGFARFSDQRARERFVHSMIEPDPDLGGRAYLPESGPTIVFENLTPAQRDRIRAALQGVGQWFDDVQFRTMS
jgi:hypothetical protein